MFSFCGRDLCTAFREVVDQVRCYSARPGGDGGVEVHPDKGHLFDVVKEALGLKELRVVETGGNAYLVSPLDPDALVATLDQLITHRATLPH